MTIQFLCQYGPYKLGDTVTLTAAEETSLVAQKFATTDLTGGTPYIPKVDLPSPKPVFSTTDSNGNTVLQAGGSVISVAGGGAAGVAGSVWRVTAGIPANSLGINGDFALQSNGDVYQKTAGTYTAVANIRGVAGANGRGVANIARTSGTGAAGTTDTYTITFTDSTTFTYTVVNGANGAGGSGGSVASPVYSADITAGRTLTAADLSTNAAPILLVYNSAANGVFTIPTDATLGLAGTSNAEIVVYQKSTGRIDVVAGAGVTLNNYAGAPTSLQYVTTRFHRVGVNTWSMQ